MRTQTSYTLIGAFVITGAFLLTAGLVVLGARDPGEAVLCETFIAESVTGLDKGADVRFRGVLVGQVQELGMARYYYPETSANYVVVRFKIYNRLRERIDDVDLTQQIQGMISGGLRVRLASSGLTGDSYIEADVNPDWVEKYPAQDPKALQMENEDRLYIPAAASSLKSLVDALEGILDELGRTDISGLVEEAKIAIRGIDEQVRELRLAELREEGKLLLTKAQQTLDIVNADLPDVMAGVKGSLAEIEGAARDARTVLQNPSVEGTLANAESATAEINRLLKDPEMRAIAKNVNRVLKSADAAVADIRGALAPVQKVIVDVRRLVQGKGRDVDAILRNLEQLTTHLNNLSATLEKYPSFAIFGNPPPETKPRK